MWWAAMLGAAAATAGCASIDGNGVEPGERRVSYVCDRGPGVTVVYAGDTARIEGADGQTISLPRRPSASGFWYQSPTHSLRGQGGDIYYTIGRMAPMTCRPN